MPTRRHTYPSLPRYAVTKCAAQPKTNAPRTACYYDTKCSYNNWCIVGFHWRNKHAHVVQCFQRSQASVLWRELKRSHLSSIPSYALISIPSHASDLQRWLRHPLPRGFLLLQRQMRLPGA